MDLLDRIAAVVAIMIFVGIFVYHIFLDNLFFDFVERAGKKIARRAKKRAKEG